MNGADDGPRCSLISYVVPPGLSRAPLIEPADPLPYIAPLEGVSARRSCVPHRPTNTPVVASSSPPPSPVTERSTRVRTTSETASSCTTQTDLVVSKPSKVPLGKNNEDSHANRPRKSCLTKPTQPVVPARLNLKKKTVAFGHTVNVSQTIEGTSRLSKQKQAMNKSMQSTKATETVAENKENEPEEPSTENKEGSLLDILKDIKMTLDVLKARDEERADELRNVRRLVDERGKEVDVLRGMFADYISKDCPQSADSNIYAFNKGNAQEEGGSRPHHEKPSRNLSPQRRDKYLYSPPPRTVAKVASRRDCDSDEIDGITFEEFKRLLTTNPALRQFVLDIRHEETDQRAGYADRRKVTNKFESPRWNGSPRRAERVRETAPEPAKRFEEVKRREPRGAKFTEKVTVERSIRCSPPELAQYSVDTRRYIEDKILEEESGDVQSLYRPGESVSYYPERHRQRGYAGDLNDSDMEDDRTGRKHDMTVEERRRQRRDRRHQDY